jgi:DNA-binding Xre family transcriptional regulator
MATLLIKIPIAEKNSMYSKAILNKYIAERLKQKGWTANQLSKELNVTQANLSRALNQDPFNLTLPQFAVLCSKLEFTPEQIYHIITGKKKKEATLQLLKSSIDSTLENLTK